MSNGENVVSVLITETSVAVVDSWLVHEVLRGHDPEIRRVDEYALALVWNSIHESDPAAHGFTRAMAARASAMSSDFSDS